MDNYKIVNNDDPNDDLGLGEFETDEEAYIEAVRVLGWSLVKTDDLED